MRVGWGRPRAPCPQLGPRLSLPGFTPAPSSQAPSLASPTRVCIAPLPAAGPQIRVLRRPPPPRWPWSVLTAHLLAAALQVSPHPAAALRPPDLERQRGAPRVLSAWPPPPSAQASRARAGCPGGLKPMQEARAAGDSSEHRELCIPLAAASKMGRGMLYFRSFFHLAF